MSEKIKTDVAIVGAGISGLATAHFLAREKLNVRIFDRAGRTGGTIGTDRVKGFLVEHGPNSALDTTPLIHQLFRELDIEDAVEYANDKASNRYVVRDGRLNNLPMSPPAFLKSRLFSTKAKLRLVREPFIKPSKPDADESLAGFVRRRLGDELLDYAINPFVAGVYAGDPENLSVAAAFPKLHALEQRYGSLIKGAVRGARERRKRKETSKQSARLFSFREGMQTMVDALTAEFTGAVHTNTEVGTIRREPSGFALDAESNGTRHTVFSRAVVLAIPAYVYDRIELGFDFPLREKLVEIEYPPVSMVFFGYNGDPSAVPLDGFGFLVPKKENKNILGTIWSSVIFPNRAPAGGVALTTFVGGSRQPENALLPDDQLVRTVKTDLEDLMGVKAAPDVVVIKRWKKAIPQYRLGHRKLVAAIEDFERSCPGFHISGNFRGGISVGDCITQADATARRVVSGLGETRMESVG